MAGGLLRTPNECLGWHLVRASEAPPVTGTASTLGDEGPRSPAPFQALSTLCRSPWPGDFEAPQRPLPKQPQNVLPDTPYNRRKISTLTRGLRAPEIRQSLVCYDTTEHATRARQEPQAPRNPVGHCPVRALASLLRRLPGYHNVAHCNCKGTLPTAGAVGAAPGGTVRCSVQRAQRCDL